MNDPVRPIGSPLSALDQTGNDESRRRYG